LVILRGNTVEIIAQEKFTISGTISDASDGEGLIGATIKIVELGSGSTTNVYGFYSVTVESGSYNLEYSYIGYETVVMKIELNESQKINIELPTQSTALEEVVIIAEQQDENIRSTQMSVNKLSVAEISAIPVVFGEPDVIKTLQLLPGIKSSEGGGGFFVRGGSQDQNLILLDEAPVYNASHLLGFFSVFNSDAIKDLSIYKGHIPAEYGGRASSVLDIKMNDGNNKRLNVSGGIGLIASRLTVEAPIVKDKGSFIISGRRTYLDLFGKLSSNEDVSSSSLYFYDFNAKANYKLGEKDRIYLSGYFGKDKFGFSDLFGFDWGNTTATARWNHIFSDKLFANTTLLYSNYKYNVNIEGEEDLNDGFLITSNIEDYSIKQDFDYFLTPGHTLKFGVNAIHHTFVPGQFTPDIGSNLNAILLQEKYAFETAAYLSNDITLSDNINLNVGLRYSWFAQVGEGDISTYDENGNTVSTEYFEENEIIKSYHGLEPRLGVSYTINDEKSVKLSYGRNRQYLHLISNSTTGTPIDLWVPSSNNVKPQIADQLALGYFQNFNENKYESSVEVYYKDMQNQIDYRTGAELVFNEDVESQLLFGVGRSYGAEFYLKKKQGRLTGWVSYTLSKTERNFDGIDDGEWYPATWDRTHDLSIVAMYKLNSKWTLSSSFAFRTGDARTFPIGKYQIDNQTVNLFGDRNQNRIPNYHRLDIGATKQLKKNDRYESSLNFSLYNAYGNRNTFQLQFDEDPDDPSRSRVNRISLFNFIPSITYNFKFK